jgi:hypothetical protein
MSAVSAGRYRRRPEPGPLLESATVAVIGMFPRPQSGYKTMPIFVIRLFLFRTCHETCR